MRWFIISGPRVQPKSGAYAKWKAYIAKYCKGQCVYCSITEGEYGGIDNFHVDHFRPKSVFAALTNDIRNLYLACGICNRFKSDDWPSEPDDKGAIAAFLDPSAASYHQHIRLITNSVELEGSTVAGIFMIERLYLNRPQLLRLRRGIKQRLEIDGLLNFFQDHLDEIANAGPEGGSIVLEFSKLSIELNRLVSLFSTARPYTEGEIKRPKKQSAKKYVKSK